MTICLTRLKNTFAPRTNIHLNQPYLAIVVLCSLLNPAWATVNPGFVENTVTTLLKLPVSMTIATDGRILVTEKAGRIRVIERGILLTAPLLDITSQINSTGDRGLLSVAMDPDFKTNQWIYVHYTANTPSIHNRISRFTVNGNSVVPRSEKILLDIQPLSTDNHHNGGAIHFAKTGELLIAVGDNRNSSNAQTLANLKGKMLRINKDGSIPTTNPFYAQAKGINRAIYALGLRNPFTFAVKPGTNTVFVNDVGESKWEEVNVLTQGANYGWPIVSGVARNPSFKDPRIAYPHSGPEPTGCAIAGGDFYNPSIKQFPLDYVGDYFYGDFCSGWIQRYDVATNVSTPFATDLIFVVDIQVAPNGTLYVLERGGSLKSVTWVGP